VPFPSLEIDMLRSFAALLLAVCLTAPASAAKPPPPLNAGPGDYAKRADVRAFIAEMADEYGFDRAQLRGVFAQARYQRAVVAAMDRPLREPPKWYEYAPIFLTGERIDAGVAYWAAHADDLARAEQRFGVPAEIIVAILGVETLYGRNIGSYRTVDVLATLAFDYPRRAAFFRGELKQFLLLARELRLPALNAKGSFAGALGVPQFMPGSYRNYAVDFDGSGRADLWNSASDVVASVANFLARHDWQPGQPVLLTAKIDDRARDEVLRKLDGGLSERRALSAWSADGVAPVAAPDDLAPDPVGVLLLEEKPEGGDAESYWIACNNFYVLTRYNRSRLYATAVYELAKAVRAARGDTSR
jgi:membrane-bound lytic murein transglycosylase B